MDYVLDISMGPHFLRTNLNYFIETDIVAQPIETVKSSPTNTNVEFSNSDIRYCRYCGNRIEADSKFCKYCGKPTNTKRVFGNFNFGKVFCFFRILKCKIKLPKFQFRKSESSNSKITGCLKYVAPLCLLFGIVGIALCCIYFNHSWVYDGFRCYGVHDKFALFLGFSIAIVLCGLLTWSFSIWHRKSKLHFIKVITFSFASLTYIACVGNIISAVVSLCKFEKYSHSIELDNAIADNNNPLHAESLEHFFASVNGHLNDRNGYPRQVVDILRSEAKANNALAQNELGQHYFSYIEWPKKQPDYERAIYWFMKAFENGNPAGAYNVGLCYDYGKGVGENIEEAVAWTQKAAEMGYGRAELKMGDFYKEGVDSWHGIWSQRECESADNRIYQFAISTGETQYTSSVLPKDLTQAKLWWQKASSHGEVEAIQRLESFYQ